MASRKENIKLRLQMIEDLKSKPRPEPKVEVIVEEPKVEIIEDKPKKKRIKEEAPQE